MSECYSSCCHPLAIYNTFALAPPSLTKAKALLSTSINGPSLYRIAIGSTSAVFAIPDSDEIVKCGDVNPFPTMTDEQLTLTNNTTNCNIRNEAMMHRRIQRAFKTANFTAVHIPRFLSYVPVDDSKKSQEIQATLRFPANVFRGLNQPDGYLFAERIPSVPRNIQEALVEVFCNDSTLGNKMLASAHEKGHCLIQPLLGKRSDRKPRSVRSLDDFELHVDQMRDLGVDIESMTRSMAEALALMHWVAHVDARGVEFVLAAPPTAIHDAVTVWTPEQNPTTHPTTNTYPYMSTYCHLNSNPNNTASTITQLANRNQNRALHLWALDFNRVSILPTTDNNNNNNNRNRNNNEERIIAMALDAFLDNKPFFPRPFHGPSPSATISAHEAQIWELFGEVYLAKTCEIRGDIDMLPERFLQAVDDHFAGRLVTYDGDADDEWCDEF